MGIYTEIVNHQEKISVVGLGYVGLPLAVSFSRVADVIGFDINENVIKAYLSGKDPTNEVGSDVLSEVNIEFTNDEHKLKEAKFHIVAVPTPINQDKTPNLLLMEEASRIVGRNLVKGSIVVFESTVYPGVTEEFCVPILERASGLKSEIDFSVGYSPERINPGDKVNRLESIKKIVSGMNKKTLDEIASVYESVVIAGVHKVSSIRVAEAAKVVENSQRDINIAFMNELAMVLDRMNIDTKEVLNAMNTKWNALGFQPGLVGGHCIGVDPYYFLYEAERLDFHSQIISASRRINNSMPKFVTEQIIKHLIATNKVISKAKIAILGVTFKENCPDVRNSKVMEIVNLLEGYSVKPILVDPYADGEAFYKLYEHTLTNISEVSEMDCLVLAVSHSQYREMKLQEMDVLFKELPVKEKVIIDVKSIMNHDEVIQSGHCYWRL